MPTKKPTLLHFLLLILLLQLARCQHYDGQSESFQALLGKQNQQWQHRNRQQVYNINWFWTTPASAVPNEFQMNRLENFTETAESQEKIKMTTINKSRQKRQQQKTKSRRQKKNARKDQTKEDADIARIRSDLMREFANRHGEKIRRSRRYADLFDGSGYLLDHMEELRQYESRAEEHHHRQRRSADNSKDSQSDFKPEELPNFSSLTELLKHLNNGPQGDIIQAGLNLRFVAEKINQRHKRSNSDDNNNDDDDDEDKWSREREAEASIQRLDDMLKDLARYLDQEHLDAAEDDKDSQTKTEHQSLPFMAGFNKQLSGAHKALVQLRDMLVTAAASGRMSSMHAMPHKSAKWRVNAESLRDNVQQLRQIYRQMDEL